MTEKTATNVMRRKAGEGRAAPEVGRMTLSRAWKVAMPHAAQDTLGVQAAILRVDESRVVSGDLSALVPEHGLITLLEGPDERFGIAVIDSPILAGLIEATTTGRIAARPPAPREPTRTDAIISADLLDALFEGFEAGLAEMADAPNLAGYRYASPLVDVRAMDMTLAEGPYSLFRLTVDLGGGVRQGDILVAFPVAPRGVPVADVTAFQKALSDNVMAAPTELEASLFRLRLPISEVTELAAGDMLKIPLAALASVGIEVSGRRVAMARLGQQGGFRALRIASLAGAEEEEPADGKFEDVTPSPALALPPADFVRGDDEGLPDLKDLPLAADGGLADLAGVPFDNDGELPDLSAFGENGGELPDPQDLPNLGGDEEDEE